MDKHLLSKIPFAFEYRQNNLQENASHAGIQKVRICKMGHFNKKKIFDASVHQNEKEKKILNLRQ